MNFLKKDLVYFILFVAILTLFFSLGFTLPGLMESPTINLKGFIYTLTHWFFIYSFTFLILYALSINKIILAIFLPILFFIGASLTFFRINYGAILSPILIDASFQNNGISILADLISVSLIIFCLLSILVSIVFVWIRNKYIVVNKPLVHTIAITLIILISFSLLSFRFKSNLMQHYPFNVYYNLKEFYRNKEAKNTIRVLPDTSALCQCNDSLIVVFVIGESLRADHLQLNGYARETNPILSKNKEVISLPNIYSEYTHTNTSVAHILSSADSSSIQKRHTETSFISLFNRAGYHTSWLANQNPTYGYISFIEESDTIIYAQPERSVYGYSTWLDEDIFPHFDFVLNKNEEKNCKLILMQTIGSHWYYNNHYSDDFQQFTPITKSKIISQCSKEEITNSYDNTILYTDYFLSELIKRIADKNSILIYLSDHGELLGEDEKWLHASDNDILRNPAALVWMSDKYRQLFPEKYESIIMNKDKRYRTDFLFHSILSAGEINTKIIDNSQNIFTTP